MTALTARHARAGHGRRPYGSLLIQRFSVSFRQARWILLPMLLLMMMGAAAAEQPSSAVKSWLDRISQSSERHSYQGTFIYRSESQLMAMRVVHAASSDGPRERLVSLNGPSHEITQSADRITAVVASNRKHIVRGRPAGGVVGQSLKPADVMEGIYVVSEAGQDRVAGRPTQLVRISPRDQYRHGFQLWLDSQTGIVLRSDMYNNDGDIIEQVMFTEIEFVSQEDALAVLAENAEPPDPQAANSTGVAPAPLPPSRWQVEHVPQGFELADRYVTLEDGKGAKHDNNEQLVFSDGLASVSVFIEPKDEHRLPFTGRAQIGAMAAYGRVANGYQVTAVGEVPPATVEMIAESLRHLGNQ